MSREEGTKHTPVRRYEAGAWVSAEEPLALEAPLHIRLNGVAYTTTMRTPGDDEALARGLLFTEGIVPAADAPCAYRVLDDPETGLPACIEVSVPEAFVAKAVEGRRTVMASASCGVCGTREPADIEVYGPPLEPRHDARLDLARVPDLRRRMQGGQAIFRATGGCHAAALFDAKDQLLTLMEDIGRHNAVDKAVGTLLRTARLHDAAVLFVSGRVSYEIVYKAYRAGVPILLAVSSASSLAVDTAARLGIAVAGFCREDRATVYCHATRFTVTETAS
jgi:FdhD protein